MANYWLDKRRSVGYSPELLDAKDMANEILEADFPDFSVMGKLTTADIKFARLVERLQDRIQDGSWFWIKRHLVQNCGVSYEFCDELVHAVEGIEPTNWREIAREDVVRSRKVER